MKLALPHHRLSCWKRVVISICWITLLGLLAGCSAGTTPLAQTTPTLTATATTTPTSIPIQAPTVMPSPAAAMPESRGTTQLVYDGQSGTLLLFGGSGTGPVLGIDDTWTWNGSTWTQHHPLHSPPPRDNGTIAYDAATQQVILFGGISDEGNTPIIGDTWIWNGTDWSEPHLTVAPPARDFASMAYDAATRQVVLFGGGGSGPRIGGVIPPPLDDTWTWNGSTWTQQHPETSPEARTQAGMAYDANTHDVLLFGGSKENGPIELNDTWAWNGTDWLQFHPVSQPPVSMAIPEGTLYPYEPTMDYDAVTHQIILALMGVDQNTNYKQQVDWAWNGVTWSPLRGTTPDGDFGTVVYDPAINSVIEFTFYLHALADMFENKLWAWNGQGWKLLEDWS